MRRNVQTLLMLLLHLILLGDGFRRACIRQKLKVPAVLSRGFKRCSPSFEISSQSKSRSEEYSVDTLPVVEDFDDLDLGLVSPTYRSGFVSIIGNANVGKSSLLKSLIPGVALSAISSKPQTTQHSIDGIVSGNDFQLIFTDTPGSSSFDSLYSFIQPIV